MSVHFEIKERIIDNIKIIEIIGELDALVAPIFKEKIDSLFSNNSINIIIDFKNLVHINSLGMGILRGKLREAKEKNGTIKLINLNNHINTLFDMIGLNEIFEIYTSEVLAVQSFQKNKN